MASSVSDTGGFGPYWEIYKIKHQNPYNDVSEQTDKIVEGEVESQKQNGTHVLWTNESVSAFTRQFIAYVNASRGCLRHDENRCDMCDKAVGVAKVAIYEVAKNDSKEHLKLCIPTCQTQNSPSKKECENKGLSEFFSVAFVPNLA